MVCEITLNFSIQTTDQITDLLTKFRLKKKSKEPAKVELIFNYYVTVSKIKETKAVYI